MPKPPQPPEPRDAQPRSPAPSIDPVLTWPTPGREDLLFFVERNGDLPANKKWNFGDQYRGGGHYPDHKLVYVSPQSPEKWSRWFYASDRINQEDYNFEFTGDQLTRSYLVMRDKYYARTAAQAAAAVTEVIGEFTRPVVATADTRFAQFVYAEDALSRTETELDSLYIVVRQIYVPERLISYQWDDVLQRVIKVTRQVVPAQTETGSGTYGTQVEIQPRNIFHDFKITSEVQWLPEDLDGNGNPDYPIQIDSVAADANYQFPPLLKSIKLFGAWAFATSAAPPDYAEDFFFENDIVEPAPGPYDATVLRFITDDPEAVRALYPTTKITARAETFGIVKWWASSHEKGNRAFALAREYQSPAAVHDEIELPGVINYAQGGMRFDSGYGPGSKNLPATPRFSDYMAMTTTIAGVDTRRSRLGLWEVQVTRVNAGGATVYDDDQSSARTLRPGTGSGILEDDQEIVGARTISISPATANATSAVAPSPLGGNYTIKVWSDPTFAYGPPPLYEIIYTAVPVTWDINDLWITTTEDPEILPYSPAGQRSAKFVITYSANNTGVERTGTITFRNSATGAEKTFTLVQPA
jgi:hypothetical protein